MTVYYFTSGSWQYLNTHPHLFTLIPKVKASTDNYSRSFKEHSSPFDLPLCLQWDTFSGLLLRQLVLRHPLYLRSFTWCCKAYGQQEQSWHLLSSFAPLAVTKGYGTYSIYFHIFQDYLRYKQKFSFSVPYKIQEMWIPTAIFHWKQHLFSLI